MSGSLQPSAGIRAPSLAPQQKHCIVRVYKSVSTDAREVVLTCMVSLDGSNHEKRVSPDWGDLDVSRSMVVSDTQTDICIEVKEIQNWEPISTLTVEQFIASSLVLGDRNPSVSFRFTSNTNELDKPFFCILQLSQGKTGTPTLVQVCIKCTGPKDSNNSLKAAGLGICGIALGLAIYFLLKLH